MNGIIKLIPVTTPVEGMKVVLDYNNIYVHPEKWVTGKIGSGGSLKVPMIRGADYSFTRPVSELKQIMVSYNYKNYDGVDTYTHYKTLPIHPSDWEYAIKHIGEEIEFNKEHILGSNSLANITVLGDEAKLIIPSPVLYTEEEVRMFALNCFNHALLFAHKEQSNESYFRFNTIWEQNKKK